MKEIIETVINNESTTTMNNTQNKENFFLINAKEKFVPSYADGGFGIKTIKTKVGVRGFIDIMHFANNDINPRSATNNPVVKAIKDTLDFIPSLYSLMTKGIVIATLHCRPQDNNTIQMSMYEPNTADERLKSLEGIMDGGHNAFAVASYIIGVLFPDVKPFKTWNEMKAYWKKHYSEIVNKFDFLGGEDKKEFRFTIPVEIVSPADENDNADYCEAISCICSARNNNVQLTKAAKDNHEGCYDFLKEILPANKYAIKWRPGQENATIKVEDVVSMAYLPLLFLQKNTNRLDPKTFGAFNAINVYSSKSKCVESFSKVLSSENFSDYPEGEAHYVLTSPLIKSALSMTEDIMKFFDRLYEKFPSLYNRYGGKFGHIAGVERKENTKYLFYTNSATAGYQYSYGFFYPLLCAVTELMEYNAKTDTLSWKVNPASDDFDLDKLNLSIYANMFDMVGKNPNKIGKNETFYQVAAMAFRSYPVKKAA